MLFVDFFHDTRLLELKSCGKACNSRTELTWFERPLQILINKGEHRRMEFEYYYLCLMRIKLNLLVRTQPLHIGSETGHKVRNE